MLLISLWSHNSNEFNLGFHLFFFSNVHLGVLLQNYLQWGASNLFSCSKLSGCLNALLIRMSFSKKTECLGLSGYFINIFKESIDLVKPIPIVDSVLSQDLRH